MKVLSSFLAFGLVLALFSSCTLFDKDLKAARNLEGDWDINSFTIDGQEAMQVLFTSVTFEFEEYDRGNDEGDFTFRVTYTDGSTDVESGEYLVDEDGTNLELNYSSGGDLENWDLDLEKDDLEMSAVIDGFSYIIKAERD
jgi:hypothetical protein